MRSKVLFFIGIACCGFSQEAPLRASFNLLRWEARENGLAYAIQGGNVKNPQMEPNWGFRCGIGAQLPKDQWGVDLIATHFHARAPVSAKTKEEKVLYPVWNYPLEEGYVDEAKGRWRLHMGALDLLLSRCCQISDYFFLAPFAGLKGAILRQKYQIAYQGGSLFPQSSDQVSMKNKSFSGGPKIGLEMDWNILSWLCFSAKGAVSFLYGYFYIHESDHAKIGVKDRFEVHERLHITTLCSEALLGLKIFWKNFSFQMGWEQQIFFDQSQWLRFTAPFKNSLICNPQNLTLQGWVLGVSGKF